MMTLQCAVCAAQLVIWSVVAGDAWRCCSSADAAEWFGWGSVQRHSLCTWDVVGAVCWWRCPRWRWTVVLFSCTCHILVLFIRVISVSRLVPLTSCLGLLVCLAVCESDYSQSHYGWIFSELFGRVGLGTKHNQLGWNDPYPNSGFSFGYL